MSYNLHKLYQMNKRVRYCNLPLLMIHFSLIIHHNMGIKCAEDSFNMGLFFCFYYLRRPLYWVNFQTPNTHIRAFHTGLLYHPSGWHPKPHGIDQRQHADPDKETGDLPYIPQGL